MNRRIKNTIIICAGIAFFLLSVPVFSQEVALDEEFYSTKKKIRVTDGIGRGYSKEIALQNAIIDARKKALVRVTSTFRHVLSESKDGEFVDSSVAEDVHAKIISKEKIISVKYDHDLSFAPYQLAIVDVEITVSFLDLDYFTEEILKTAEAAMIRSMVIAGWGQIFNRSYYAGTTMALITYGSIGYGYHRQSKIAGARNAYNSATDPTDAERKYKILREHQRVAATMYTIGVITWGYSVWEAFEDRERADEILDKVHDMYFPKFRYDRKVSPIQKFMMKNMRPSW